MLPEVTLKDVTRDDVDRIAWWLEDRELSSSWFGHYSCGDPVHRGYDPQHMLEAPDWEWARVFGDPSRLIFSIYSDRDEHIGECQVVMDGGGGAELALLIGRKDMWHHGYGTSTVIALLDKVFDELRLTKGWVNVPEDNVPALGLFEKLGFVIEATRELCTRSDGAAINASILAIDRTSYRSNERQSLPLVTISGMPGSGFEVVGAKVAGLTGSRFVDGEISDLMAERLNCTEAEIEALESTQTSFWSRLINTIALPMELSTSFEGGYPWITPDQMQNYDAGFGGYLTREHYLGGLAGVVKKIAAEGDLVLRGNGCHRYVPPKADALHVFVSASPQFRQRQIASTAGTGLEEAGRLLSRMDRDVLDVCKHLHGFDLQDAQQYEVLVNVDRVSLDIAAQMVVGALKVAVPSEKVVAESPVAGALARV